MHLVESSRLQQLQVLLSARLAILFLPQGEEVIEMLSIEGLHVLIILIDTFSFIDIVLVLLLLRLNIRKHLTMALHC